MSALETDLAEVAGRVVRLLRVARGLDQGTLGAALGVSQALVSKLETGRVVLTVEHIGIVADLFALEPSQIARLIEATTDRLMRAGVHVSMRRISRTGDRAMWRMSKAAVDKFCVLTHQEFQS